MTTKEWRLSHEASVVRRVAAGGLRVASRLLTRLARRVAVRRSLDMATPPMYEFHAEAGAPEGALYVDGKLVGHLPGVSRL